MLCAGTQRVEPPMLEVRVPSAVNPGSGTTVNLPFSSGISSVSVPVHQAAVGVVTALPSLVPVTSPSQPFS